MELDCCMGRGQDGQFSRVVKRAGLAACVALGAMALCASAAWGTVRRGMHVWKLPVTGTGDFEMGNFTGWTQFGDTSFSGVENFLVHGGTWSSEYGPTNPGGISQAIACNAGDIVTISFWYEANLSAKTPSTARLMAHRW